jgi:hypothetical protein
MSSSGNAPWTRQLVQGRGDAERGNEFGLGIFRSGIFDYNAKGGPQLFLNIHRRQKSQRAGYTKRAFFLFWTRRRYALSAPPVSGWQTD